MTEQQFTVPKIQTTRAKKNPRKFVNFKGDRHYLPNHLNEAQLKKFVYARFKVPKKPKKKPAPKKKAAPKQKTSGNINYHPVKAVAQVINNGQPTNSYQQAPNMFDARVAEQVRQLQRDRENDRSIEATIERRIHDQMAQHRPPQHRPPKRRPCRRR